MDKLRITFKRGIIPKMSTELRIAPGYEYLTKWCMEVGSQGFINLPEYDKGTIVNVINAATKIIPQVAMLPQNLKEGRSGATILVASPKRNILPIVVPINEVDQKDSEFGTKATKHLAFALGKFAVDHLRGGNHGSSINKYLLQYYVNDTLVPGGSVSYDGWFVAISGFNPDKIDEAAAIGSMFRAGILPSIHAACELADYLNNDDFPDNIPTFT